MNESCIQEESVHLYLDGELSAGAQPGLFVHLADCEACRSIMNAMMGFRRMSRREAIQVPPVADERVLARLEKSKKGRISRDRYYERRPLWQSRATVSFRVGAALAALFFALGAMIQHHSGAGKEPEPLRLEQQADLRLSGAHTKLVYVLYPGLLVEARRPSEPAEHP